MSLPKLSKEQEKLKGKKAVNMTNDELIAWIRVCGIMEKAGLPNKARRSWTASRDEAKEELRKRETLNK